MTEMERKGLDYSKRYARVESKSNAVKIPKWWKWWRRWFGKKNK